MALQNIDPMVGDLAGLALNHGIESIRDAGGPLIPFVLTETGEGRAIQRFMAQTLEESLAQARQFVRERVEQFDRAVVAYDGFITVEGQRSDAIFALVYSKGEPATHLFAQRYIPKRFLSRLKPFGDPLYVGPGKDVKN